jgi:acyl-CoA synthetase (AMP-forming)/AMP-acid ligase II
VLLTSPEGAETALKAAKAASISIDRVFLFGDPDENPAHPHIRPWTDVFCSPEEVRSWSWKRITTLEEATSTTAVVNYSSGTTGLPKGVEVTHYNLVANSEQVIFKRNSVADTPLGRQRKANIDSSGERWLAPLPMYHAYGQTYSCMSAARIGAKVFILPNFTLQKYLQFLDIYRITFMTTVPTILTMLDKYENPHHFNLKAIEVVTSGSAPLNGEIAARITEKYMRAGVKVKQGWGLTETTCSVTGFPPDEDDDGRSIGWLNPNCAVKIVPTDDDGQATTKALETVGEIWVAGPNMMKGYWRNEKATRETVVESDGYRWVRTGDIGYVDGRGCIYIVDRLKVRNMTIDFLLTFSQLTVYFASIGTDQSQRPSSGTRGAAAHSGNSP